ncbi:helix-turn-helix transcriptional regulator [Bacillus haynesii]|uniref:helix-turn-helix transcriptional regulator n=1 Tax=Bacillus haynesii TaxID=1925021 RepID=UPI002282FC47|nr:helix-turn-helix transcriptional regulator [Bacillus haynesii]MCY9434196.1 helix-turn-helix transcriptional regulator [Bacillus haynesii]MEC0754632.1 helix-turn-helix transcriptional regulator [Bacillus haynesii]
MDKQLIAQRLVILRAEKPRTQVANDLGISVSALQMYENGHRIPRDEIKVRLASYYNKTVQEIFFNNQPHELRGKSITA